MKKRLLAGFLTVALVTGCMAGCGSSGENDSAAADSSGEEFKIAVGLTDSGSTMFSLMHTNVEEVITDLGGEVVFQGGVAASADATIQFVEDQIAAGADGIIIGPPSDSVLTTVCNLCEEAGVYWGITFRSIMDEEVKEYVEASEYYVGNCFEDEEETGYQVMSNLHNLGIEKVAIISQAKGNTTTDLREQGAQRACDEFGMEIVAESRDLTQASDATSAAESFLTAYDDLDAIFIVGTTGTGIHEAVAKAIEDAGKIDTVKLATIDFPDAMAELFENNCLVTCSGLPSWGYDPYIISCVLANTVKGTPISEEPVSFSIPMFDINDLDTANKWLEKYGDASTLYYEADYITSTLDKANNEDLTEESMVEIIQQFVDAAVE